MIVIARTKTRIPAIWHLLGWGWALGLLCVGLGACGRPDVVPLAQGTAAPAPSVPTVTPPSGLNPVSSPMVQTATPVSAYPAPPSSPSPTVPPVTPAPIQTPGSAPTPQPLPELPSPELALLPQHDFEFVPADAATLANVPITKSQAIAAVWHGQVSATGISAILGHLRNPKLQQEAQNGMHVDPVWADAGIVWLVTLHGVPSVDNGPAVPANGPTATPPQIHIGRVTWVVSSQTGAILMGWNY